MSDPATPNRKAARVLDSDSAATSGSRPAVIAAIRNRAMFQAAMSPAIFAYLASRNDSQRYIPARHHLRIGESIVDLERGRIELLVNQAPVQHGKTLLGSVWTSAWMLGLHPTWRILAASHSSEFAEQYIGGPARDIIERHGERFFNIRVDQTSRSRQRWNTTVGGGMTAVGVGTGVAGQPADVILVDDPYPGIAEALNEKYRRDIVDWFRGNILPRRKPVMRLAATMSRWHEDDFIAWLIRTAHENGWNYRVLDFPAIAICRADGCDKPEIRVVDQSDGTRAPQLVLCEHGVRDELGRLPGEALWPDVRPISFLLRQFVDATRRNFMALWQGRPQAASGSIFKREWFRYYREVDGLLQLLGTGGEVIRSYLRQSCRIFQMVDLAAGDTTTLRSGITRAKPRPDFTVIGTFALCPDNELVVLDIYRDDKIEGPDQVPLMGSLRNKHRAGRIGIEAVQYQWTSVQAAVRAGLPAVPIPRGRESKETRAWVVAARMEVGAVFFREGAPWLDALENELLLFPAGPNDDQVDVLSDAGAAVAEAMDRPIPRGVQI